MRRPTELILISGLCSMSMGRLRCNVLQQWHSLNFQYPVRIKPEVFLTTVFSEYNAGGVSPLPGCEDSASPQSPWAGGTPRSGTPAVRTSCIDDLN